MINITTTKKDRPIDLSIGLFGFSGTGKSSLTKTIPRDKDEEVLFIDIENGLEVLREFDFSAIKFDEVEGDDALSKMTNIINYLRDNQGKYKWIVMDSFSRYAEKMKMDFENNPGKYDLITKHGVFDGQKMYGKLLQKYSASIYAFLGLKGHKIAIFGAEERVIGGSPIINVLIDGSYRKRIMYSFDEFWGLKVVGKGEDDRKIVTNSDGVYMAKSRMDGGSGGKLDTYEEPNIEAIIEKCYGK